MIRMKIADWKNHCSGFGNNRNDDSNSSLRIFWFYL